MEHQNCAQVKFNGGIDPLKVHQDFSGSPEFEKGSSMKIQSPYAANMNECLNLTQDIPVAQVKVCSMKPTSC